YANRRWPIRVIMMSKQSHLRVKLKLATPLGVLLAVLSAAVAVLGQVSESMRTGDASPLRRLWTPRFDTQAKWDDDLAVSSPGDLAAMERPADGGLWLSGDTALGFAHLQWIAGNQLPGVLQIDRNGKVFINAKELARAVGISAGMDLMDWQHIASFV